MTDNSKLIERLLEASGEATLKAWSVDVGKDKYQLASVLLSEAATALQAAQDALAYDAMMAEQLCNALERREARIKELEVELTDAFKALRTLIHERDEARQQRDEYLNNAFILKLDLDEARRALEPFAKQADRYDPVEGDDDHPLWGAHTLTIGDVRRARSASDREGGEE